MMQVMAEVPQKATLLQVLRMVFSAFLGIRKRVDHESIVVTPVQVIIVGLMAAAVFVGTVVSVVRLVIR
jgi:tetraacyldisaccharide-1-P 4'-kinase